MFEEVSLGQVLSTMTTSTKVKIIRDSDIIYIGNAPDAFDTSSQDTLSEIVMSVKATGSNSQLIRL